MSAFGTKRTWSSALHMSAFGGKAEMGWIAEYSRCAVTLVTANVADVTALPLRSLIYTDAA